MRTRSRWSTSLIPLLALTYTACTDPASAPPLSFDELVAEEELTLKGDGTELGGSCPDGFISFFVGVGGKMDFNLNGWTCVTPDFAKHIDDILAVEGADTEFAGGQGTYAISKKIGTQNVTFAFHGRQNKQMVVKGEFELNDHANNLRIHGDVNCLIVNKNKAMLGGVVTQSTDPKLPVGVHLVWFTTDNGEGINEPVDLVSRPTPTKSKEACKGLFALEQEVKILHGNIQVMQ
jgi:hypothetical protein